MCAAFDTTSHTIVLDRLENLGFKGESRPRAYLIDHYQFVDVNVDSHSSHIKVMFGVPNGSVLDQLFFTLLLAKFLYIA